MKKVFFIFVCLVLLTNLVIAGENVFLHQDIEKQNKYLVAELTEKIIDSIQVDINGIDLKNYGQPDELLALAYKQETGPIAQITDTASAITFAFKADWPSDPWPYEFRAIVKKTLFAKKEVGKIIFFEDEDINEKVIVKVSLVSLVCWFLWLGALSLVIFIKNKNSVIAAIATVATTFSFVAFIGVSLTTSVAFVFVAVSLAISNAFAFITIHTISNRIVKIFLIISLVLAAIAWLLVYL